MADSKMEYNGEKVQLSITEDEAALYDRQIRLWGLDAQQKMRNATVLVVRLKGVATEAIKNIVLAGIGKLIVVDDEPVDETDLGCGFFFPEGSVGQPRVEAAKPQIQSLNPLVNVVAVSDFGCLSNGQISTTLAEVDLVCVTDCQKDEMLRLNDACRLSNKLFYAGGTYGILGFVFADLLAHKYLAQDRTAASGGATKTTKQSLTYPSLRESFSHSWKGLAKRQTKEQNPSAVFSVLGELAAAKQPALWEWESQHQEYVRSDSGAEVRRIAAEMIKSAGVNAQPDPVPSTAAVDSLCATAKHEFSPICAIVGGFLGQDILKALGAKEPPISNFLVFDGSTGAASVVPMNMSASS
ncbi:hypothetical protein FRC10_004453 [Ceratobasidium sp. 414]|nr:hypothetical protein FRC10_004453 [Ceratobasidium sp. 414]